MGPGGNDALYDLQILLLVTKLTGICGLIMKLKMLSTKKAEKGGKTLSLVCYTIHPPAMFSKVKMRN